MAQTKKDEIFNLIVKTAKKEFLRHGFRETSLRTVAAGSNVTLSNLYTYFENKDDLFAECLREELDDLGKLPGHFRDHRPADGELFDSLEVKGEQINFALQYIEAHRAELDLLFNRSGGSKLETYFEETVGGYQKNMDRYFGYLEQKLGSKRFKKPSGFLTRRICHFQLKTLAEMIRDRASIREMRDRMAEMASFSRYGFWGFVLDKKGEIK